MNVDEIEEPSMLLKMSKETCKKKNASLLSIMYLVPLVIDNTIPKGEIWVVNTAKKLLAVVTNIALTGDYLTYDVKLSKPLEYISIEILADKEE